MSLIKEGIFLSEICGSETEFGLLGPEMDLERIHERFVGDFINLHKVGRAIWDPTERLSGSDVDRDNHQYYELKLWLEQFNMFLRNGARFYLDGDHAEMSSPLCFGLEQVIAYTFAGFRWIDEIRKWHERESGDRYSVFRNNVAKNAIRRNVNIFEPGISFAHHFNFLGRRGKEYERHFLPFLICSQPFWGSGKVGSDHSELPWVPFQLAQRPDFLVEEIGPSTMGERPWWNTRDEPHADVRRYVRNHIIAMDSNMLELPHYLKYGLSMILGAMVEEDCVDKRFRLLSPVQYGWAIARDLQFENKYYLYSSDKPLGVLDILSMYLEYFAEFLIKRHPERADLLRVVLVSEEVLKRLKSRDRLKRLFGWLDWTTKKRLIEGKLGRMGKDWDSAEAYQMDLHYHNNDHDRGLLYIGGGKSVFAGSKRILGKEMEAKIVAAMNIPPANRSHWLQSLREKFIDRVVSYDWASITIDTTGKDLAMLYFGEPRLEWDPEKAQTILALPLEEAITALVSEGIAARFDLGRRSSEPYKSMPLRMDPNTDDSDRDYRERRISRTYDWFDWSA